MHKKYIDKIIMSTDNRKMEDLERVFLDTISYIAEIDPKTYDKIEEDLYEIAEGRVLTEEKAKKWVNSMKPRAKWTLEEISQIKNKYNTNLPLLAAYTIMNMLFSDLGDVIR